MLLSSSLALLLGILVRPSWSVTMPQSALCVDAIFEVYADLTFDGIGADSYYIGACQNPLRVTSLYAAAKLYCSPREIKSGLKYIEALCRQYGEVSMLPESALAENLTDDAIKRMPVKDYGDIPATENVTAPFILSPHWFELSDRTVFEWDFEMRTHANYGFAIYGFWGGVLLIGILNRLWQLFYHSRLARVTSDVEGDGQPIRRKTLSPTSPLGIVSKAYNWVQTHLVIPSTLDSHHRRLYLWCTIPTRMQSLTIGSYWVISILLCCVNYRGFTGNLYWSDVPEQIWRYVADRTGILSYANLPWLWVFSGRNNIFIWATGWQFSTFNLFHRHIARVATLAAIIHSVGYVVFYYLGDPTGADLRLEMKDAWLYLGVLATVAMSLLVVFSVSWFRQALYESFLLVHIVLSLMTIVALFYHTDIFEGDYDPYLWPLVAIWCFDRGVRLVRIAYCNLHVSFNKGKKLSHTRSSISYDGDSNMMRIQLTVRGSHLKPRPGQHYFLYQPFRWTGYENHPFTLAYWETPGSHTPTPPSQSSSTSSTTNLPPTDKSPPTQIHTSAIPSPTNPDETLLEFWLRPFDGWTRHLRSACQLSPSTPISPTILLEGPYGHTEPLWTAYDSVLMVAGGAGITAMTPYLLDHSHRRRAGGGTRTRRLTLVWADRSAAFLRSSSASGGVLAEALSADGFRAELFVTGGSASGSGSEKEEEEEAGAEKTKGGAVAEAAHVQVRRGRPDVGLAVGAAAREAWEAGWRVAVVVCGPAGMADAARAAVFAAKREYGGTVEYIEEAFGW